MDAGAANYSEWDRQETSDWAYASIVAYLPDIERTIIYDMWRQRDKGATCDEIEERTSQLHQTISASLTMLRKRSVIFDTGLRRPTRTERAAIVWALRHPEDIDPSKLRNPCPYVPKGRRNMTTVKITAELSLPKDVLFSSIPAVAKGQLLERMEKVLVAGFDKTKMKAVITTIDGEIIPRTRRAKGAAV